MSYVTSSGKVIPTWMVRTRRVLEIINTAGGCWLREPPPPPRSQRRKRFRRAVR